MHIAYISCPSSTPGNTGKLQQYPAGPVTRDTRVVLTPSQPLEVRGVSAGAWFPGQFVASGSTRIRWFH